MSCIFLQGQYEDYIGAGHADDIVVTASHQATYNGWEQSASAMASVDGSGMDAKYMEAARFLHQASLGYDHEDVQRLLEVGALDWLEQQRTLPYSPILNRLDGIYDDCNALIIANGGTVDEDRPPAYRHWNYAWWTNAMTQDDLLGQRVTYALSQVLVVSDASGLESKIRGMADYYDMLRSNAFGNYRMLLDELVHHPAMGLYLSHLNNPKTDLENNTRPDENFAREIMQLFTIGLHEMNIDGTMKLDGQGNLIPTYSIPEIKEFSKIFTGLGAGALVDNPYTDTPQFGTAANLIDYSVPMVMYDEWHESGVKTLLNGQVTEAGNTGEQDIQVAIDNLFNHPNLPPFIATRLIKNMVKSNPTPAYVQRVAETFANNGQGVRGDLFAVVKAILMDPEARNCTSLQSETQGKVVEPLLRYTAFARMMDKDSPDDYLWNSGNSFRMATGQAPLGALSVFNFFLPSYSPGGDLAAQGLVGPEFQIHDSRAAIAYINEVDKWINHGVIMDTAEDIFPVGLDLLELESLATEPRALTDELDRILLFGRMSNELRGEIESAIELVLDAPQVEDSIGESVKMALYLVLISPEFAVVH